MFLIKILDDLLFKLSQNKKQKSEVNRVKTLFYKKVTKNKKGKNEKGSV